VTQQRFSENTKNKKELASSGTISWERLLFIENPEGRQHNKSL